MHVYAQCTASYAFDSMFTHQLRLHHAQISYAQCIQICTHTQQKCAMYLTFMHTITYSCTHTHTDTQTHFSLSDAS